MKKVLLIYEDYAEGTKTQSYLKKIGFDVVFQNNDHRINDQILTLNPDIVLSCGMQKFSSLSVGAKLKEIPNFRAKSILILPQGFRPNPMELTKARVDVLIEAPVQAERLIQVIAKLVNLDSTSLLEKFKKAKLADPSLLDDIPHRTQGSSPEQRDSVMVRGGGYQHEPIQLSDKTRADKYQKFVQGMQIDKTQTSHSRQAIKDSQNDLKKGWDFKFLDKIDELKRQFTQALFKK